MSYRGVKRVLGETRLELKCLVLFAVCLLTLIGGSFWWYGGKTEDLVYDKTRKTCQNLIEAAMLWKHWITDQSLNAKDFVPLVEMWAKKMQSETYTPSFISVDHVA